ncbi:MAG: FKBP-type peptidyl-prolyl cis-trans isomerase [Gammaproteobacteria bacterium]|jgi:FKBP-type peptidyl-prolyl cis-trans isomerase FklB
MLKKLSWLLLIVPSMVVMAKPLKTEEDRVAYSLGHVAGEHIKSQIKEGIAINPEIFIEGVRDSMQNKSQLSEDDIIKALNVLKTKQIEHNKKNLHSKATLNLKTAKEFLEQNKQNKNIVELANGLQYQIIESGDGTAVSPKQNDKVKVAYRGMLLNGTEFDSSYNRGEPAVFELKMLIKGWQEALLLMKPKAKWKIFVPPELAYGREGAGPMIEPNSALIFDIELLAVNPS